MKTKTNIILSKLSTSINKLSHLEFVVLVLGITMICMYFGFELGRDYARM